MLRMQSKLTSVLWLLICAVVSISSVESKTAATQMKTEKASTKENEKTKALTAVKAKITPTFKPTPTKSAHISHPKPSLNPPALSGATSQIPILEKKLTSTPTSITLPPTTTRPRPKASSHLPILLHKNATMHKSYQKGLQFQAAGMWLLAIDQFETALQAEPQNETYRTSLSNACVKYGDLTRNESKYSVAIEMYKKVLALEPSNRTAQTHLAECTKHLNRPTPGLIIPAWNGRSSQVTPLSLNLRTGNSRTPTPRSYAPYQRDTSSMSTVPDLPPRTIAQAPSANRGPDLNQLMAERKFSEAAAILDTVLKVSPLDHKAWFNLGVCRQALKDYHGALAAYEMVTNLSPGDTAAKVAADQLKVFVEKEKAEKERLAAAAQADKERQEAEEKAKTARRERFSSLISNGDYKAALPLASELVKSNPADSEIWFDLGRCRQGTEDHHNALAAYEMASRLNPGNSAFKNAVEKIREFLNTPGQAAPPMPSNFDPFKPGRPSLSTAKDVDFGPYMEDLKRRLKRAWFPPKNSCDLKFSTVFKIHSDGVMSNLRLDSCSGLAIADWAALKAVKNAAPFRPLPFGSGDQVEVKCYFGYDDALPKEGEYHCIYMRCFAVGESFRSF